MTSPVYVCEEHGSVYALFRDQDSDGDCLLQTPMFTDGSYDQNQDNWAEVDMMALFGEEQEIQDKVNFIFDYLQQSTM
tara:strand:- start:21 stop:254 length:234 start_codon:yes stop_codon:yes gene_type:complete